MSATTSIFPELPRELRDMIWQAAASVQFQQIADGQPTSSMSPNLFAERLRQAFIGYDSLPKGTERQPLRVYVHDFGDELKLGINEFQTFVNTLPMATVCTEARSQTVDFCRAQIGLVDLVCSHENAPPDELSDFGHEIVDPIFGQLVTVEVNTSHDQTKDPKVFKSAAHLVDVVHRVFGNGIERIILRGQFRSWRSFEELYWPNTLQVKALRYLKVLTSDQHHEKCAVFMTPESTAYKTVQVVDRRRSGTYYVSWHLLRFHEIVDASTHKLPRLQTIKVEHDTYNWDEPMPTRIEATIQDDGTLWVDWSNVEISFPHSFAGFNGDPAEWSD